MNYLLFFAWLILLGYTLTKIRFVKNAELGSWLTAGVFVCTVIAGMVGGRISESNPNLDTWLYHREALTEYHLLFTDPANYFTNLFDSGYAHRYGGLLQVDNNYWNDLKTNLIIKLISVFDIFSGGNYYINVIFFNFTIFFGHVGIYRVFKALYQPNKILLLLVVFFIPSLLFYSSTIHKDGLMLAATGIILYNVFTLLTQPGAMLKRLFFISLALLLLFLFRNYMLFAMVPALTALLIAAKSGLSPVKIFLWVYVVATVFFFASGYLFPAVNLPQYMVNKQEAFKALGEAHTSIPLQKPEPTPAGFAKLAPQAIQHAFLRPFVTDSRLSIMLLPLSVEVLLYEVLIILLLFFRKPNPLLNDPFVLFCLFFAGTVCLIIGYTVPVIGAIVRYRSIFLPLLLAPVVFNIDWTKLLSLLNIRKK